MSSVSAPASAPARAGSKPAARPRKPARKQWWLVPGIAVVSAALAWGFGSLSALAVLEAKTYDLSFLLRPWVPAWLAPRGLPGPVTVVMIDAPTDDYLQKPRMLWPAEYGEVFRAAADGGARVIGLDWYFSYPVTRWDPEADRRLFQYYQEVTTRGVPVILAYERIEKERATEALVPIYYQAGADGNMGYVQLTTDEDNFIRRQELVSREGYPSLAGRVAAAFLGAQAPQVTASGLRIVGPAARGNREIPAVGERTMAINFYGPRRTFPIVSMAAVLGAARKGNTEQLRNWFQNRAVLIGADDLQDRHPTPFFREGGQTEGVEIHANTVSTILNGDFMRVSSTRFDLFLVLAIALLAAAIGFRLRWPYGPLAAVAIIVGVFLLALVAHARGWDLPVVRPELATLLATAGAYLGRSLTQDRYRRLLERTFSNFVSREVVQEILEVGSVPLEGTRQEVTILFSDIRDFTTYSERCEPEKLVDELNEYFHEMAVSITGHGGMLNKYIGDGIMALFGAPVPRADHAERAVRCAVDMVARSRALNQQRNARGLQDLKIGVGIHTGDALVGNIGAQDMKMEYTAMGDTVNVASRIEGANKEFGTQILLSESTRERLGGKMPTVFVGRPNLKGKTEVVTVYTVEEK